MFSPSFREMVKGRLREFWREPSASFFVILVPLMWMLIFGVAFSGGDKVNYGIGLISETQSDTPSSENWHMGADWISFAINSLKTTDLESTKVIEAKSMRFLSVDASLPQLKKVIVNTKSW